MSQYHYIEIFWNKTVDLSKKFTETRGWKYEESISSS